jgi:hypothetical protein
LVAVVAELALEAELRVLALPEVVVDLARLPLLAQRVLLSQRAVLAQRAVLPLLAVLALLEVVADLALLEVVEELAVEEVSVEALHRSFSAAMVGNLPSPGTPRYSPVPRSGRKAKRRP